MMTPEEMMEWIASVKAAGDNIFSQKRMDEYHRRTYGARLNAEIDADIRKVLDLKG